VSLTDECATAWRHRQWSFLLQVFLLHFVIRLWLLMDDIVHSEKVVHGDLTGVGDLYTSVFLMIECWIMTEQRLD